MTHAGRHAGFTLIELVMVMVMVGALATFALPRMTDVTAWRLRACGNTRRSMHVAASDSRTPSRC
jgi:prepilin-type N-terminal cleavage/methylation domain-containing protein